MSLDKAAKYLNLPYWKNPYANGKEYWKSRLHRGGECRGRYTKKLTHRKERRESKRITRMEYGDETQLRIQE